VFNLWASGRVPEVWAGMAQWRGHSPPTNVARNDSQTRRHMWVEFVVGSRPCSEGFFSGSSSFSSLLKKQHFQISIRSKNPRATGLSVEKLFSVTLVKKVDFSPLVLGWCCLFLRSFENLCWNEKVKVKDNNNRQMSWHSSAVFVNGWIGNEVVTMDCVFLTFLFVHRRLFAVAPTLNPFRPCRPRYQLDTVKR